VYFHHNTYDKAYKVLEEYIKKGIKKAEREQLKMLEIKSEHYDLIGIEDK